MQKKIGKYIVKQKIGQGGMGSVYLAEDPDLKQDVVLKEMSVASNEEAFKRFEREAQLLSKLSHPNIIKFLNYFKEGGFPFLGMEYVDGISLDQMILMKGPVKPEIAGIILGFLCDALQYANEEYEVIHRDIKPANVFISSDDGAIKLGDFGISSLRMDGSATKITHSGQMMGTPAYMAPEIFQDNVPADKKYTVFSDIYALGVMLYEMLLGKCPFGEGSYFTVVNNVVNNKYTNFNDATIAVPGPFQKVIRKCLNEKPESRYSSFREFKKDINKAVGINTDEISGPELKARIKDYLVSEEKEETPTAMEVDTGELKRVKSSLSLYKSLFFMTFALLILAGLYHFIFPVGEKKEVKKETEPTRPTNKTVLAQLENDSISKENSLVQFEIALDGDEEYFEKFNYKRPDFINVHIDREDEANYIKAQLDSVYENDGKLTYTGRYILLNSKITHNIRAEANEYFEKQIIRMNFYPYEIQKKKYKKTEHHRKVVNITLARRYSMPAKVKFTILPSIDKRQYLFIQGKKFSKWKPKEDYKFKTGYPYNVLIDHPAYYPYREKITLDESDNYIEYFIKLVKRSAKIQIRTNPNDAKIFIDGEVAGELGEEVKKYDSYGRTGGSPLYIEPRDKRYKFRFVLNNDEGGYYYKDTTVKVESSDQYEIKAELNQSVALTVNSEPAEADVFVNDEASGYQGENDSAYGKTPATLYFDEGKEVNVKVYKKDLFFSQKIQTRKEMEPINAKLEVLPEASFELTGIDVLYDISSTDSKSFTEKGKAIEYPLSESRVYRPDPGVYTFKAIYKKFEGMFYERIITSFPHISRKRIRRLPQIRIVDTLKSGESMKKIDLNFFNYYGAFYPNLKNVYLELYRHTTGDAGNPIQYQVKPLPMNIKEPIFLVHDLDYHFDLVIEKERYPIKFKAQKGTVYFLAVNKTESGLNVELKELPYEKGKLASQVKFVDWSNVLRGE